MSNLDSKSTLTRQPLTSEVVNTSGATSDIIRQYFPDGQSAIIKRAKAGFNQDLRREYSALLVMNGSPNVPQAYDDFPPRNTQESYAFRMEDLENYSPLFNRSTGQDYRQHLSVLDRVALSIQLVNCISEANQRGLIHNDLQLANLMCRNDQQKISLKVIDWGEAQKITPGNQIKDNVTQAAEVIKQLFDGNRIPSAIEQWLNKSTQNIFKDPKEAWEDFAMAKDQYLQTDIQDSDLDKP